MDINCRNNATSFGCLKGNMLMKSSGELAKELAEAQNSLRNCKHWHVLADENGMRLLNTDKAKVYELADRPKRHAPNSLLIRTYDKEHKIQGKVTSFKIEYKNMDEVKAMYKKIMSAHGIERFVIVAKALEEQVIKRNRQNKLKHMLQPSL